MVAQRRCLHHHLRPILTTPIDALQAERTFRVDASVVGLVNVNQHPPPPLVAQSNKDQNIRDDDGYLRYTTLHELAQNATLAYSANPLFGTYEKMKRPPYSMNTIGDKEEEEGTYQWSTYADFGQDVALVRTILRDQLGIVPYSKVGIISNNRREWATLAAACYSLSVALVPMYEAQLPKDWTYILNDSGCAALVCSTEDVYHRTTKETLPNVPLITQDQVLCLDAPVNEPHSYLGAMSRAIAASKIQDCVVVKDNTAWKKENAPSYDYKHVGGVVAPTPNDLANLIYTSGTTGKPKGVELIHGNQVSNIHGCRDMAVRPELDFPMASDRSLAFLPWAHSYGQTTELWCLMSQGASMGICRGIPTILEDLKLVQPTLLFAVPALYKKVHDGVINGMNTASPLKQVLMRAALRLGKADAAYRNDCNMCNDDEDDGSRGTLPKSSPPLGVIDGIKHTVLDTIVLSKIRALFGGKLRAGFVAGAACPKEILHFMDAIGIPVCEGYGLTETSPVIAFNNRSRRKVGTVGQVIRGVTVWVVDSEGKPVGSPGEEGEICCSGPNVMKGYHNNPDATTEVITLAPDGQSRMFHTGDLGNVDIDGYMSITGRIKELYKLENGKYVCPAPIEEAIGMSRFISQVVVCGANRPYNIALIVPDWISIRSELHLKEDMCEEELVNDDRVLGLINSEIKLNCYKTKKFEIPAAFAFVAPFTAANNMVTPKMSIRRHIVIKTFEDLISDLYERRVNRLGEDLKGKDELDAA